MSPLTETSQGEESDTMFPAANDAPAVGNLDDQTRHMQAVGELSPPYSQDQGDADEDEAMDLTGGEPALDASSQNMHAGSGNVSVTRSEFARSAEAKHEPGASWDNQKARDEYEKHWHGLLDKNFSLSKFVFARLGASVADDFF